MGGVKRRHHAFVIFGLDPRIHAVTCLVVAAVPDRVRVLHRRRTAGRYGMDPRVYAASLRSLLRPRMTKEGVKRRHHAFVILGPDPRIHSVTAVVVGTVPDRAQC